MAFSVAHNQGKYLIIVDLTSSTASGGEEKEKKPAERLVPCLGVTNDIAIEALCKEVSPKSLHMLSILLLVQSGA